MSLCYVTKSVTTSGLTILLHGILSQPDMTLCDKRLFLNLEMIFNYILTCTNHKTLFKYWNYFWLWMIIYQSQNFSKVEILFKITWEWVIFCKWDFSSATVIVLKFLILSYSVPNQMLVSRAGVTVYLAPMDSLPPRGQAVPGYLAPHPGYLHPRGASCPGWFILPPANTSKNICMLFCYFSESF